jgi:lysophospholipid acyltransferase
VAADGRRLIRPLFLTPDGKHPLPSKKYYDIFTTLLTQVVFAYVVAPFILLGFSDTLKVWARVYFYTLVGVAASFALFSRNLPIRKQLVQRQAARLPPAATLDESAIEKTAREEVKREKLARTNSQESFASRKQSILGIPDDPEAEIDEIVREVKAEIEERRRRGSVMQGFEVKKAVQDKLKQFKKP